MVNIMPKKQDDLDRILYEQVPIAEEAFIKAFEKRVDYSHTFSEAFEKKMDKLIHKEQRLRFAEKAGKVLRYAAIIALILIGVSLPFGGMAKAAALVERIKTVIGDMFFYEYKTDVDVEDIGTPELRLPTYVPEGYECEDSYISAISCDAAYVNEAGQMITYYHYIIQDGKRIYYDSEYDYEEKEEFLGREIIFYCYDEGFTIAIYVQGMYCYEISIESLDKNEIYKILESAILE
ncbi:MAG: DUF4367 domain-containing protein [Lachnospiraceae bacterium]|nr:DUF4367 domain-containing protein [Lachnospiraceae bacterium]